MLVPIWEIKNPVATRGCNWGRTTLNPPGLKTLCGCVRMRINMLRLSGMIKCSDLGSWACKQDVLFKVEQIHWTSLIIIMQMIWDRGICRNNVAYVHIQFTVVGIQMLR